MQIEEIINGKLFLFYLFSWGTLLLTQYCAGGKIETNEMGRACAAYGGG